MDRRRALATIPEVQNHDTLGNPISSAADKDLVGRRPSHGQVLGRYDVDVAVVHDAGRADVDGFVDVLWDPSSRQHLIHVVGTHPLVTAGRHDGERRVEAVKMPMQIAVVARHDTLPTSRVRPVGRKPGPFAGVGAAGPRRAREGRLAAPKAENGCVVALSQLVRIAVFYYSVPVRAGHLAAT